MMDDQIILAVDDQGIFRGEYIPKSVGHTGEGRRHLAITVLIYNNRDQVLLQRRKHKVFDDIWDITGATHPLHLGDKQSLPSGEGRDETVEEATLRCLKREYNIQNVVLSNLGSFNYFSQDGGFCEHEHCYLLIGEFNDLVELNPEVGYEHKWVKKQDFLEDIEQNPQKYSAWAKEAVMLLKTNNFFD